MYRKFHSMKVGGRKLSNREKVQLTVGIFCVLFGAVTVFMLGNEFSKFATSIHKHGPGMIVAVFAASAMTIFGFWLLLRLLK